MRAALMAVVFLAGCAGMVGPVAPSSVSGNFVTTVHGTARYFDALQGAEQYCAMRGMGVRGLGTDTPPQSMSVSRFECVPR